MNCVTATFAVSPNRAPEVTTIGYLPHKLLAHQTGRAWLVLTDKLNLIPR
ncbi:MAG TPA: hypothetical protein VLG40_05330 [Candidatus Saccharimonas sp.]|nr:hypothetical protein [Candidatus Saccharimonas sp.]